MDELNGGRVDPNGGGSAVGLRRRVGRHWPLILSLVFAAAIGSWRLADRGVVFVDEGVHVLEARWVGAKLSYIASHVSDGFDERYFVLHDGAGRPPASGKPLHALLNAGAIGLLPWSDVTSILVMQGVFGLGIIAGVYAIAWRLAGRLAAGAAAMVLAASSMFLAYRRAALAEMDSGLFFMFAVLALMILVQRGPLRFKHALLIGILGGLSFTANDRWYVALPALIVLALVLDRRTRSWAGLRAGGGTVAGVVAGFAVPILVFEAVSVASIWMGHDARVTVPYRTYFQQLEARYLTVVNARGAGPRLPQILHSPYPGYIAAYEGIPWVVVGGAATLFLIVRWRREHVVPLTWILGPMLLASASPLVAPRYMTLAIPAIALGIGVALQRLWEKRRRFARPLAVAAVFVLLVSSLVHAPRIFRLRAGWTAALTAIEGQGGRLISPKSYPLAATIGRERVVLGYEESLEWKREQQRKGARWLLLEIWLPPGAPIAGAAAKTVAPPGTVGPLSRPYLEEGRPLYVERSPATGYVYEGYEGFMDRVLLLYRL